MIRWLTLSVLLFCIGLSTNACNTQSFYIENNAVTEGFVLTTFQSNLNECAKRCTKQKFCNAANFILSLNNDPYCMLIDTTRNGSANKMPVADSVVYTLKPYCLEKPNLCINREWSFEKYPRYEPLNDHFVMKSISNTTLQNCLNLCAEVQCEAAIYSRKNSHCRLARVTLNNVNSIRQYFKRSNQIDLYENNCPNRQFDKRNCNFIRINQAGFVDVFDERIDNIRNQQECESECLSWNKGHCRSYTYNKRTKHCYMSHASQKALGRSVLDSLSEDLSSGELNDCVNFELDCHGQSLTLTAKSLKLIKGTIKSKKGRDFLCEETISENYTFQREFPFDKCGITRQKADDLTFAGLLMFKEGSTDLITIHDKLIEVKCKIHDQLHRQQDNQLSFHLEVEDNNVTTSLIEKQKTTTIPVKQAETFTKYRLDVLNSTGQLAEVVDVGQQGYLLITIEDVETANNTDGFLITELIAEDSVNVVKLIDSKGCVTDTPLIQSIDRISSKEMKVKILFDGFPDQSQVTYQTLVKPCHGDKCYLECNSKFYVSNHTDKQIGGHAKFHRINRRDLKNRVTRHVALAEEVYKIRAQSTLENAERKFIELLTTQQPSWTNSKNPLQGKGNGNFLQCFTEDLSCMFSMLFAGLQVMLILFCSGIVYNFLSKWIRYYQTRNLHAADRRPSSFDDVHYDFGADTSFMDSQTSTSLNSTRLTSTTTGTQGKK